MSQRRKARRDPGALSAARKIARAIAKWFNTDPATWKEKGWNVKVVTRDKRRAARARRRLSAGEIKRMPLVIDRNRAIVQIRWRAVPIEKGMPALPKEASLPSRKGRKYAVGVRILCAPVPGDKDPWRSVSPLVTSQREWRGNTRNAARDVAQLPSQRAEIKFRGKTVVGTPIVRGVSVYVSVEK